MSFVTGASNDADTHVPVKNSADIVNDHPLGWFHGRLAACSGGCAFLDGYILAIFGVAMTQIGPEFGLSAAAKGGLAATLLIGVFLGGTFGGYLTDRFGRQRIYKWDIAIIAVLSLASFWVDSILALVIARFLVGIAVGVDLPIAPALLTELSPSRLRGPFLGIFITMFFVGGAGAYLAGEVLMSVIGDGAWRWMLASAVVPAILIVLMRIGIPESPLWLAAQGRVEEANAVMRQVFGPGAVVDVEESPTTKPTRYGLTAIVRAGYGGRLAYVIGMWMCLIIPVYAVFSFGPQLISAMHLEGRASTVGAAVIEIMFAVGCIGALLTVNKMGRRTMTVWSYGLASIPMLGLAVVSNAPALWSAAMFVAYAVATGGMEVMSYVYPNELFPTEMRGSAMGIVHAVTRTGAATGTFLVPISLETLGLQTTMFIGFLITVFGLVISILWAPETRGMSLSESSNIST